MLTARFPRRLATALVALCACWLAAGTSTAAVAQVGTSLRGAQFKGTFIDAPADELGFRVQFRHGRPWKALVRWEIELECEDGTTARSRSAELSVRFLTERVFHADSIGPISEPAGASLYLVHGRISKNGRRATGYLIREVNYWDSSDATGQPDCGTAGRAKWAARRVA